MSAPNIDRINQLAQKSRTDEGLSEQEKQEQAQLRKEYIAGFRGNLEAQLKNVVIVEKDGTQTAVKKRSDETK